jgi:hypothetical protein
MTSTWWTVALAILGGLATLAAALKAASEIYERYLKRKIVVDRSLTSSPQIGNSIWITNLSDKPLLISAWDVIWARRRLWRWVQTNHCEGSDWDSDGIEIKPNARVRLDFADGRHFGTGAKMREQFGQLYFRVWRPGSRGARWFHLL